MSKKKKAAVLIGLAAAALAALIASGAGSASAFTPDTAPSHVAIYLENNNHNPGTVTTSCGPAGPLLHTALFNDHPGNTGPETAVVYAEPTGPTTSLGTIVAGPVDIPLGGSVPVALPYVAGTNYNAVAVAKGDPLPTTLTALLQYMTAKPPTADNSQLLVSGYPGDPECPVKLGVGLGSGNPDLPKKFTASCDANGSLKMTADIYNLATGGQVTETVKLYLMPTGGTIALGSPIAGPVDIPAGGHLSVTFPYTPGSTFVALAVKKGTAFPTTVKDLGKDLSDHVITQDMYLPKVPDACSIPCPGPTTSPEKNDTAVTVKTTCPPTTSPTSVTTSPSATVTTTAATTPPTGTASTTVTAGASASSPAATTPIATTTQMSGPTLAHTGSTAVPLAVGAGVLMLAGGGAIGYSRFARRSH